MPSPRGSLSRTLLALFSAGLCLCVLPSEARPTSLMSGSALAEQADYIYAFRHVSFRAKGSPTGTVFLYMKYSELVSFKGARPFFRGGVLIVESPPGDFAPGRHMEFPPDTITLVFLTKEKGTLRFTSDNPMQATPSFHYEGSLTQFRSLQELLIYAARQSQSPISPFCQLLGEKVLPNSPAP